MRGISQKTLDQFGVYKDDMGNIVFPLKEDFKTMSYANFENMPKYLLPSGFVKSEFLYGFDKQDFTKHNYIFITEGYFDVMSLVDNDLPAVGLLGTTLSNKQIEMLQELQIKNIVLALDRDAPGIDATLDIGKKLTEAGFIVSDFYNESTINQITVGEPFKDMNELYELCPKTFPYGVNFDTSTPFDVFMVDYLVQKLSEKQSAVTVEDATTTIHTYLEYTQYVESSSEQELQNLKNLQEALGVTDKFMDLTIQDYIENEVVDKVQKQAVSIEKGKLLENGQGVFSLNVGGIHINNIYVSDSDKGIFINMPQNKAKDGKYYDFIKFGYQFKNQIEFAMLKSFVELKHGIAFEPRTLPLQMSDEFKIKEGSTRTYGTITFFELENPHFSIDGMRHVQTENADFITFEQHKGKDDKYYSHFFADKELLGTLKSTLFQEVESAKTESVQDIPFEEDFEAS